MKNKIIFTVIKLLVSLIVAIYAVSNSFPLDILVGMIAGLSIGYHIAELQFLIEEN